MKNTKPIYILFFLITLSALDSVAQSPIYLYLKNGVIETFYPELTDSMTVSNIDENGNEYDEPIVQRIYSNDSVYVYNLIDIDSIGLYVPPTILKPGVIDINKELINYVIGSEDLTLTLSDNTPNKIIPHKGDKLVFAAVTDIFPHGFAGEVQSVQTDANGNYNLDCELVTLTDIFEQYYSSSTKKEAVSRYYDYGTIPWKPGTIPIDLELDGIFPIKKLPDVELKAHYHGSFTPDFQIYIEQIISRRDFYSTKVTVVGEYDLGTTLEVAGEISNRDDHRLILWQPNAGIPFISKFFLEAGWIGGGNCKGSLTLNTFARRTFAFSRHWVTIAPQFEGTSNIKQTPPSGRELYGDYSLSGSLEGGFNVGLYLEAGFAFLDKRILSVGVRGEIGCEISGQISITQSGPQMESTEFYDNLKENYIKGELYAKGAFGLDYFEFGKDHEDKKNPHIKWTWMETPPLSYELFNFSLVPSFSKPVVTKNSQYPKYTDIASEVSNISLPASIGYAIKNSKGEIVESSYVAEGWNWGGGVMDKFNLQYTSEALKKGRDYTIYPLVKWNFWPYCEMIASPSSDFSDPLIIITSTSSQILASSARIHGIIDDYDSSSDIELGFYYGESPVINLNYGTYVSSTSENNGVFVCDLKNLKPETQYYYRACAIFDGEVIFADETQSFTTQKEEGVLDVDLSGTDIWVSPVSAYFIFPNINSQKQADEIYIKIYTNLDKTSYLQPRVNYNYIGCSDHIWGLHPSTTYRYEIYLRSTQEAPITGSFTTTSEVKVATPDVQLNLDDWRYTDFSNSNYDNRSIISSVVKFESPVILSGVSSYRFIHDNVASENHIFGGDNIVMGTIYSDSPENLTFLNPDISQPEPGGPDYNPGYSKKLSPGTYYYRAYYNDPSNFRIQFKPDGTMAYVGPDGEEIGPALPVGATEATYKVWHLSSSYGEIREFTIPEYIDY